MITKLQIKNYRHNERLTVKLARITVFRGPSGSGKSSLIGALKWTVFNQPSGTDFIHWDHDFAATRFVVDGKHILIRKRNKTTQNYYKLDGHKYVAFGTGVPTRVTMLLNMSPLNFQRQHAGPFWFRETAGEVSRQLNAIVNLDLIDSTLANLSKQQREAQHQVKESQRRIDKAKAEKAKLQYIVDLDKRLTAVETLQEQQQDDVSKTWTLSDLIKQAKYHQFIANSFVPDITRLLGLYEGWHVRSKRIAALNSLLERAQDYAGATKRLEAGIIEGEKKLQRILGKRCPLCGRTGEQK